MKQREIPTKLKQREIPTNSYACWDSWENPRTIEIDYSVK
jgi:hypothetical protein